LKKPILIREMSDLKNISKAILESENEIFFEKDVLIKLNHSDKELFLEIWKRTLVFENWNYSSLTIGFEKTLNMLKTEFQLDDNISRILANKAAYEWK
jgi:hypothetical protein